MPNQQSVHVVKLIKERLRVIDDQIDDKLEENKLLRATLSRAEEYVVVLAAERDELMRVLES